MKVKELVRQLELLAPLNLAESWDNVGLLIEPSTDSTVKRVLTTIDLTEPVLEEAITKQCEFILSYHPPIFSSFKRLLQSNAKDRIVMKCIANNISIYSPHTSWDSIDNGVNDWIGSCFDCSLKVPITPTPSVLNAGMGRIITLSTPLPLTKICDILRGHLGIKYLRLGHADQECWARRLKSTNQQYDIIKTIGICAGSGGSLLKGVDTDLYITGEMSHHEVLAVIAEGRSVLLSEHTHTERGFLVSVVKMLHTEVEGGVEFIVSEADCNPIETI
ncbi:NIF3-like protein 1 [Bolinopsis microptera]|uniref:NIF3-like protein 1 n=1 Tax=Bolinopsis microptera TaxID=2820187 RepID=UPI00307942AE